MRAALSGLALALCAHLLGAVGVLELSHAASEALYHAIMVTAAGLCVWRVALVAGERGPWLLLALALLLWTGADITFTALYGVERTPPFPNVTDGLYLGSYVCFYAGVVLLLRARLRPLQRSLWLDGLVAGLTFAAFTAAFVFKPMLTSTEGDPLTVATTLAYPVADLLLLSFVGVAFALTRWRPDRTWSLIGVSFVLTAVADAWYAYAASAGTYVTGSPTETLWAASAVAMALAALAPRSGRERDAEDEGIAVVTISAVLALAALGLLICGWFVGLLPVAGILAALGLLAAVARAGTTFAENVVLLRASRGEALTDALSGLGNRRLLMRELEAVLAGSLPRTLVFFDLDGFKNYNDAFGHVAGDALLSRLARKLATSVHGRGVAYRLGGDEFCVLFDPPVASGDAVVAAAAEALWEHGEAFSIAASFGSAQLPREAGSADAAVRLADQRMYAHKDLRRGTGKHQAHNVLVQVLAEREPDLHEHLRHVAHLARTTAIALGIEGEELDEVVRAAELHDVGKIAVPDSVLHKPGPLDDDEWQIMRQHSVVGERILATVPALNAVAQLVRSSHESWDGRGYPDRLSGPDIPLGARIIAVCDAFDAMTSQRPYAVARPLEQAVLELRRCAATQFDPDVVSAFCAAIESTPAAVVATHA